MLRCIRSSIDAKHITLEDGQAVQRRIDEVLRRGIGPARAREIVAKELEAEQFEKRRRAELTETRRQALERDILRHRNEKGEADPASALVWLNEHHGQARFEDIETRRLAILGGAHARLDALLHEARKGLVTGDLRRRRGTARARLENIVREAFGEGTGDAAAAALARAWSDVAEDMRGRFNGAGGTIGRLEKWGLPQHHDQEAVLRAGRQSWVDRLMQPGVLDRERMTSWRTGEPLDDAELRRALEDMWDAITTEGWMKREATGQRFGRGALFRQHADHRFLQFKNADQWLAYQRDFGEGDPFAAMMGHLSTMSRDIAAMEILGPNPEAMREYLRQLVTKQAAQVRPKAHLVAEQAARLRDLMTRVEVPDEVFSKASERIGQVRAELADIGERYRVQTGGKPTRRDRRKMDKLHLELKSLERELAPYDAGEKARTVRDPAIVAKVQAELDAMVQPVPFPEVAVPLDHARRRIAEADAMWDVMRGTANAPVSSRLANGFAAARSIVSAATLGSAMISALSDVAFQAVSRNFAGLPVASLVRDQVAMLRTGGQREAVRAGLMLDSAIHVMHQQARYVGSVQARSVSGFLVDRVLALQGLSAWTQAGKHAFGMAMQAEFADRVGLAFHDLPAALRDTLERHGLGPDEWAAIRQAPLYEPEPGAHFLRPTEIQASAGRDIAERYLAMILRETRYAVPEGTIRSQAAMTAGRAGTFVGELSRNFAQFKSFGVAVLLLHGGRIAREVGAGRGARGAAYAGALLITGTMLGAMAMQLKELVQGRDPRDMKSPGFWGAAMLQGGGLGIYGDFLFSGLNRMGGGLASTLAGPLAGRVDALRNRTLGNAQEVSEGARTNFGREAVQTLREMVPGSSIWYLRLAYERVLMDQLQMQVDPAAREAFRRKVSTRKREFGNDFWWRPGTLAPQRAPALQ